MYRNKIKNGLLSAGFLAIACVTASTSSSAQSPEPAKSNTTVTSSVEFGYRYLSVNGDMEKYRSDLNYKKGVRIFDSSFLIESKDNFFDSALITAGGWGADPTGSMGLKMDKAGIFKFDSKVRKVTYFNNLKTHAFNWSQPNTGSEHRFDTRNTFGDFDLTLRPESKTFRVTMGYSFSDSNGPGAYTIRFPQFASTTTTTRGDEFQVNSFFKSRSDDLRLGVAGALAGFDLSLNYGRRVFRDNTSFTLDSFSPGNSPDPNSASINTFARYYPTKGNTNYLNFSIHRMIAERLEFTGRLIYSESTSTFNQSDIGIGTSTASGPTIPRLLVDLDRISVTGDVKRPQTRGDIGLTYRVTDKFRISNTFNFDQFNISGGNRFFETLLSRTVGGVSRPIDNSDNSSWRATSYRRLSNTIEADYQVNNRFGFHVGYRVSKRRVDLGVLDRNLVSGALTLQENEEFENTTHTFLVGAKIKPTKNWSIYMDLDRGQSDNVFTRLANNDFTNFRIRTRATIKNFSLNLSLITKDNDSPGTSVPILGTAGVILFPATETVANSKNRVFSGSVDWNPRREFTLSTGYTYNRLDSNVDVLVPIGSPILPATTWFLGKSNYVSRDSYFFVDVTARPMKRVSLYASYRIDKDPGQGNRVETRPQDIYTSYPINFQTPEARLSIRLTKNVDWNLGYQYYSYRERPTINPFAFIVIPGQLNRTFLPVAQNYTAHLPYMSLRIYFGNHAGDR